MDPDVLAELQRRAAASRPLWEKTPQEARRSRSARESVPRADGVRSRDTVIECADRALPIRIYDGGGEDDVVILFFHGGGFVTGDLNTHHDQAATIAGATGRTVVSVEYRLAPEHPFPAADRDALVAVEWARSSCGAANLGIDAPRAAVAGVSAGANLAANASREFARRGEPLVAQLLAYPWLDTTEDSESRREFTDGLGLSTRMLRWYVERYLPDPESRRHTKPSPLLDVHADRLPPTVLSVAMLDPLRDDGLAYADLLNRAGVSVSVQICERLPHGFWGMAAYSRAAAAASQELCARFTAMLDDLSPRA
jgi:acetyl esterase